MPLDLTTVQTTIASLQAQYALMAKSPIIQKTASTGAGGEQSTTLHRLDQLRDELSYWLEIESQMLGGPTGNVGYAHFVQAG